MVCISFRLFVDGISSPAFLVAISFGFNGRPALRLPEAGSAAPVPLRSNLSPVSSGSSPEERVRWPGYIPILLDTLSANTFALFV